MGAGVLDAAGHGALPYIVAAAAAFALGGMILRYERSWRDVRERLASKRALDATGEARTKRELERRGYTVLAAGDGREALDLAASHPRRIDLVLTDLVMPEVGGRELARRMRLTRPSTRILLMSGYDDEMVTGKLEGDDFLSKPFTPQALADRVASLLAAPRT